MNFNKALETLGIEEYRNRILHSNSHGELFYLEQYSTIAEILGKTEWFKEWFESIVEQAEEYWDRPESVFQHIHKILVEQITKHIKLIRHLMI